MPNGNSLSTTFELNVPTYLPLPEAAHRYNLSVNALTQPIQTGKIEAVQTPSGELLVSAEDGQPKSKEDILILSGTGDVIEPDDDIASIGSGSNFAKAAAVALKRHKAELSAEDIVRESLNIAADICIYTNHNLVVESISK